MAALDPVDRIEVGGDDAALFLVAGSFEPRSVRAAKLLDGNVDRAVVFTYDDTLDTESGRRNTREIETSLREKSRAVDVLHCKVGDPFSVVGAFHTYVTRERLVGAVRTVVLDATASLIRRAEYDRHYRQALAPADNIERCVDVLAEHIHALHEDGCSDVYTRS